MPSLINSEDVEQERFVNWLDAKGYKFSSIPNGASRSIAFAMKLKRTGFRPGLPDLLIIVKGHLVWIEMKRSDRKPKRGGSGGISSEQRMWIDALNNCENSQAYVCYSSEEAQKVIESLC